MMLCEVGNEKDVQKYHLKGWVAQKKIDGCRVWAYCESLTGHVKLKGRNGTDYTSKFPEIVEELRGFTGIFDGEIACDTFEHTLSRVQTDNKLKSKLLKDKYPAIFWIFDVPLAVPYSKRLQVIAEQGLFNKKFIKVLDYTPDLINAWETAKKENWEGIVIKNLNAIYENKRSHGCLKIKYIKSIDLEFTKYTQNNAGIRVENDLGIACQISGSQSRAVKELMDKSGKAMIEVNYLNETGNGMYRQITFKQLK